jgi:cytochrome P450/NADPH-cytochrome P450 reductase
MAAKHALDSIPRPPGKPVVGNMLSLDFAKPVQHLARLVKELGPIFWLDMMGAPFVVVSGFALVDELSDEKRFDKAVRGSLRRVRAIGGDGLFTADTREPNWSKAHHILLQPFGNRAMQSYHPMMVDIAEQLVKKWERLNADDEIDVVHDMTALTLDTIGLCGFDYRFNSFYRRDYHPFVASLVRSLETIMQTRGLPLESLWMRNRKRDMAGDVAFMNGMVDEIVAERRKNAEAAATKKDMLGAMMTGVDRATGEQLDDVNIRYQINTFLIAGHETTSGLLSCAIYALLKHPDVLRQACDEVDRVLGPDVGAKPTYQQVTQLVYITQILKECLRMWPPAPAYGVTPLKDELIGGKYPLKKGVFITVLVLALHRDKAIWGPNPDVFDPENFSREAEAARPANAWKPFGNGQRACIGRGFAMHESALALGMILQRFRLIDHTRYQMALKETLTIKPDGFKIKARPRPQGDRAPAVSHSTIVATDAAAPAAAAGVRTGHNTPLLVLYGSNLGTAEELATRVADLAELNGFATRLGPLDEFVSKLPGEGGVLIFCASYNGAPPDNAAAFVQWLTGDLPQGAFDKLRYAIFGCGNSDWAATYQSIPRLIDERLASHGGRNVFTRGEGDARSDLDGQFETWFTTLRALAAKEFGVDAGFQSNEDAPLYQVEPVAPSAVNALVGPGVAPMKIHVNSELQNRNGPNPSERSTRHIEVELPDGMTYKVGDHLSVVPRNDPTLVDAVARRFGFVPGDQISLRVAEGRRAQLPVGKPVSVGRLLSEFVELQQAASRKQIQMMADHTRCPVTKPKLLALAGDESEANELYREEVLAKRKSIFNLLDEHPACELPFHAYLEMLSLLSPRYYSISSSPRAAGPARCSITVGVVAGARESGQGVYKGVCSNFLAGRRAGDTIHAMVRETKAGFRLPDDPLRPIVMIGPGTGLAPFRGFLQERASLAAEGRTLGPAKLFFGCRRSDQDFLYADELKDYEARGLVALHVAFSRADGARTYVQHLLEEQRDSVWRMIEDGAIVYVCGDGGRMEPGVKATLMSIHCEKSGASEDSSQRWIDNMGTQNRYVLDVWASG